MSVVMKKIGLSLIALSLVTASSVIAQDVRYNFSDTHFEKFKTYKWVEFKDAQKLDEQKNQQIKDGLDVRLAKKHLTKTDADTADLYIGYQVGVGEERQFTSYNSDWGIWSRLVRRGFLRRYVPQ